MVAGLVWPQATRPPTFGEYRVARVYRGIVRPPNFGDLGQYSGTDVDCFGEEPSFYSAKHVNFAGHFVVGACGCGSGCSYLFLWDAESGKVYRTFPFRAINVGPYPSSAGRLLTFAGAQYRTDSRLLILDGCFEDTCDCAKRYYVWKGSQFKLRSLKEGPKPESCEHR